MKNDFAGKTALSCLNPLSLASGTETLQWGGETSTWEFQASVSNVGGQQIVRLTGPIVAGRFQGSQATQTIITITPNLLQCLSHTGVTSQSGPTTFSIT